MDGRMMMLGEINKLQGNRKPGFGATVSFNEAEPPSPGLWGTSHKVVYGQGHSTTSSLVA